MSNCVTCGQDIPADMPYTLAEVEAAIIASGTYEFYRDLDNRTTLHLRDKEIKVKVLDKDTAGYEEEGPTWRTFEVEGPDGLQFYKKTGHYASYDGYTWDGPLKEVMPTTKTVIVYE